jgi:hypothetical protein
LARGKHFRRVLGGDHSVKSQPRCKDCFDIRGPYFLAPLQKS